MGYFLDDSGNFENFVKIWPPTPPNYHQNTSKHTRKIMESSLKNIIFWYLSIWNFEIFRIFWKANPPVFLINRFGFSKYFPKNIFRRWGFENNLFSINKMYKSLDMNFISIKKHEIQIWWIPPNTYFFWKCLAPPPPKKISYRERF